MNFEFELDKLCGCDYEELRWGKVGEWERKSSWLAHWSHKHTPKMRTSQKSSGKSWKICTASFQGIAGDLEQSNKPSQIVKSRSYWVSSPRLVLIGHQISNNRAWIFLQMQLTGSETGFGAKYSTSFIPYLSFFLTSAGFCNDFGAKTSFIPFFSWAPALVL